MTFIFIWVVGATQVRWNRVSGHLLATAHEGDVRLWDSRKGSAPVQYIAAHLQKIHGLDWSMTQDNQLAISSQNCTAKFFDVNNPLSVENTVRKIDRFFVRKKYQKPIPPEFRFCYNL